MQYKTKINNFTCVMPMAGEGIRFSKHGYELPKPLIRINKTPMFIRAAKTFPNSFKWIFIANNKIDHNNNINKLAYRVKKKKIILIKTKTKGQASTVYKSLKYLKENEPIIVHSCDLTFKLDLKKMKKKIKNNDLLVFTTKSSIYHKKNHTQFSWVKKIKNNYKVSLKKKFKNPTNSKVLIGTFIFKNKKIMKNLLNYVFKKKLLTNNEFYMDNLIFVAHKLSYKLDELLISKYQSWGSHIELQKYIKKTKNV